MRTIDWNKMSELGLLERINTEILHPLGLAVSRTVETGSSDKVLIAEDGFFVYPNSTKLKPILTKEEIHQALDIDINTIDADDISEAYRTEVSKILKNPDETESECESKYTGKMFRVKIRKNLLTIKPEAKKLEGLIFMFARGWVIEEEDSSIYAGEIAMIPTDLSYPSDAPAWISINDLELAETLTVQGKKDWTEDSSWCTKIKLNKR